MEVTNTETLEPDEQRSKKKQKVTDGTEKRPSKQSTKAEEAEKQKIEHIRKLILEGYTTIEGDLELVETLQQEQLASPRIGSFPRNHVGNILKVFFAVNNHRVFDHVATKTSEAMDFKVRTKVVTGQNAKRYFEKQVTRKEVLSVLGLQFLFRGRRNVKTIEEQFLQIPDNLKEWPMTEKRYKAIISCFDCDFDTLSQLLRESWKNAIQAGTNFSVDEALFSYHSTTDATSPQRFIPRKPHKNGLLCYMAAFKTKKGPYIFDLEPDYQIDKLNPRTALERITQRWVWPNQPHIIADAGFSGDTAQMVVGDLKAFLTNSVNIAHNRHLFELLKMTCPLGRWLAVKDKNGTIWSIFRDENTEGEHFLATTAFVDNAPNIRDPPMKSAQISHLSKIDLRSLSILGNMIGVEISADAATLASSIAAKINSKVSNESVQDIQNESMNASKSNEKEKDNTNLELPKLRMPQLVAMAKELGLKTAGKIKDSLIQSIVVAKELQNDEIQMMIKNLTDSTKSSNPPHHSAYKDNFNGVDIHDKKWYELQSHHTIHSWRSKFSLSLLQSGIVNAYVAYRHFEVITFTDFCLQLSVELCQSD